MQKLLIRFLREENLGRRVWVGTKSVHRSDHLAAFFVYSSGDGSLGVFFAWIEIVETICEES